MPTVAYVNTDQTNPIYDTTAPGPDGVDFVLFMGSGYGPTRRREGTTHYTLDALSGDVIAAADVETSAVDLRADPASRVPYAERARGEPGQLQPERLPRSRPGVQRQPAPLEQRQRPASTSATSTGGCGSS